jgi:uncharacterized protein YdiU (UPF0061 family)
MLTNTIVELLYISHALNFNTPAHPRWQVVLRTARLVSQWQCVGFCHGVLNTNNMSILGLTLDYGPYGFMDRSDT